MRSFVKKLGIGATNASDNPDTLYTLGNSSFQGRINVSDGAFISGQSQFDTLTVNTFRTTNVVSNVMTSNVVNVSNLVCTNSCTTAFANCSSLVSNNAVCATFKCSNGLCVNTFTSNVIVSNTITAPVSVQTALCMTNALTSNSIACNVFDAVRVNTNILAANVVVCPVITTPSFTCPIVDTNTMTCDTLDTINIAATACNVVVANVQTLQCAQASIAVMNVATCNVTKLECMVCNAVTMTLTGALSANNVSATRLDAQTLASPLALLTSVTSTRINARVGTFTTNVSAPLVTCTTFSSSSADVGILACDTLNAPSVYATNAQVSNSLRINGDNMTVDSFGNVDFVGSLTQRGCQMWSANTNTVSFTGNVGVGTSTVSQGYNLDVSGPVLVRNKINVGGAVLSGTNLGRLGLGLGQSPPRTTLDIGDGTLTCGSINVLSTQQFTNAVSFQGGVSFGGGPMTFTNLVTFNTDTSVNGILTANNILTPFVMSAAQVNATTYTGLPVASIATAGIVMLTDDVSSQSVLTAPTSRIVSDIGTKAYASKDLIDSIVSVPGTIDCATALFGQAITVNGDTVTGNYGFSSGGGLLANRNGTFTLNSNQDAAYSTILLKGDTSNANVTIQNRGNKLKVFNHVGMEVGSISMAGDIMCPGNALLGGGLSGAYIQVNSSVSPSNTTSIPVTHSMFLYVFAKGTGKSGNVILSVNTGVVEVVSGPYLNGITTLLAEMVSGNVVVTTDIDCVVTYSTCGA